MTDPNKIDVEKIKSWPGVISVRVIPSAKARDYREMVWLTEKNKQKEKGNGK